MDTNHIYKKGDNILYTKNLIPIKGIIKEVHLDDYPNLYFTILLSNGIEIQTIEKYLYAYLSD